MTHAPYTSPNAYMRDFDPDRLGWLEGYQSPQPKLYNQPYTLAEYIAVLRLRLNGILGAEYKSEAMHDWLAGGIGRLENKIVQWENYQRLIEEAIKNGQPVTRTKG